MPKRTSRKRDRRKQVRAEKKRISPNMSRKLFGVYGVVLFILLALAVNITHINATRGGKYKRAVMTQAQQQYDSRTIPFQRGDITDRNGTVLATSRKVYNVILDCGVVNTETTDENAQKITPFVEPTVRALVRVLGMNETKIRSLLKDKETRNSPYQVLKENVSIADKQKFESYLNSREQDGKKLSDEEIYARSLVKGVWFEEDFVREYPFDSQACDLIGFTYDGFTADWGIEGYYSDVLNGSNGRQYGYYNADADVEQTIIPATAGKNLMSTIDINVQQIIRSNLEAYQEEMKDGPYYKNKGAENVGVVVMNPNNGEILGMDSLDWYNLNKPRDLSAYYTKDQLKKMSDEDQMKALNAIWQNFCISYAFEPGSTVKPITVAAALETGAIKEDDKFTCDGTEKVADKEIHCDVYPGSHGSITVKEAIKYSCNDALMQIAAKLGVEDILRYQDTFNLGKKTGIDLPGESAGILFTPDTMGPVELATTGFGQGFTLTMVQEAAAISSAINGGYYYKPHVIKQITDQDGAVIQNIEPTLEGRTVSKEVSETIREAMGMVMNVDDSGTGTGFKAKVAGYSMGGKTGTAETLPRGNDKYLLSLIGFAPLENPQVVVYVVVDKPNSTAQEDSTFSSGLAKNIFIDLLPYLNIYPDEEGYDQTNVDTTKVIFNWERYAKINGISNTMPVYDDGDLDNDGLQDTFVDFDGDGVEETRVDADGLVIVDESAQNQTEGYNEVQAGDPAGIGDQSQGERRDAYGETSGNNGTALPQPLQGLEDDSVTNGGNDLFSDGITNDSVLLTD